MRLLAVIPYTPTVIRTRPHHLLRALARRGHRLTLATLWENEFERAALEAFWDEGIEVLEVGLGRGRRAWNLLSGALGRRPVQAGYCWQPALVAQLESWLGQNHPDWVHVEHLRGARYGEWLQERMGVGVPILWDAVDCISLLFEKAGRESRSGFGRWITRLELPRTRRYEGQLVGKFTRTLVTSAADRAALQSLSKTAHSHKGKSKSLSEEKIKVLPNGVDLINFQPGGERVAATVTLTGKMSYHANVTAALWLVNEIMPRVWAHRPEVQVEIVGSAPVQAVRALAERDGRVLVTGYVPDVAQYLQRCTVSVAPIAYGVGIQNKVLEAMACGAAVVATPQAASALQAQAGRELLLAGDAEDFAAAVLRLLQDANLRAAMGQAGRRYVEQQHSWDVIAERYEQLVCQ